MPRLFGIIELDASDLCGTLNRKERMLSVFDVKEGTRRTGAVRQSRTPSRRSMSSEKRDVSLQDEASFHWITALDRLHKQDTARGTHLVGGRLKMLPVLFGCVTWQHANGLYGDPSLGLCLSCQDKEGKQ